MTNSSHHLFGLKAADEEEWRRWIVYIVVGAGILLVFVVWFAAWCCFCRRREAAQQVVRRVGFRGFGATLRVAGTRVDAQELRTLIPTAAEVARHKNDALGDLSGKYAQK